MNINQLFCTPEQGRRLKELVPELQFVMVWANFNDGSLIPWVSTNPDWAVDPPALTLQELRDVVNDTIPNSKWREFTNNLVCDTAPELAAWVIEWLEEVGR